jgi:Cu(I)/Ag(I) efflux system protein CusF
MKAAAIALALTVAAVSGGAVAQSAKKDTGAMDHNSMTTSAAQTHKGVGVVKKVDPKERTVTLAHDAIKTLGWPAMTMTFKVQDKAALDKLALDKKVDFEFEQRGKDYVITTAR